LNPLRRPAPSGSNQRLAFSKKWLFDFAVDGIGADGRIAVMRDKNKIELSGYGNLRANRLKSPYG